MNRRRFAKLIPAFIAPVAVPATAAAVNTSLLIPQHRLDACLLAATATNMNLASGERRYTSYSMAQVYKARHGKEDWAKDGVTSHQTQDLSRYAGFTPVYGKLTDIPSMDGAQRLKQLAREKRYPVVFLPGHAVVVLALVDQEKAFQVFDPYNGAITQPWVGRFYQSLETQKWVYFNLI